MALKKQNIILLTPYGTFNEPVLVYYHELISIAY